VDEFSYHLLRITAAAASGVLTEVGAKQFFGAISAQRWRVYTARRELQSVLGKSSSRNIFLFPPFIIFFSIFSFAVLSHVHSSYPHRSFGRSN